ncbi:MAG: NAD-dependent epimerase/dehydratase family protein [Chloroflexi bacterium]|nr:NAD-dependent epimerase/dehydratase family protein [Chloroflexota bacterium]
MRAVIIGGSGHVGTYLVPRLVEAGYEVVNVTRGRRKPYRPHGAWNAVGQVTIDRTEAEKTASFGPQIAGLKPDIVIDLICFTSESAQHLAEALRGRVQHLLVCGTIWVHGHSVVVPTTEEQPRRPFGTYGMQKAAIEAYLLNEARRNGFPATMLHPGHIVGPGWEPINPAGHKSVAVFEKLARGDELALPNLGLETLHHVYADDVAQLFMRALANWSAAVGQSFHAVSPSALTLRGYAEAVAGWFGKLARLRFLPWEEWKETASEAEAAMTHDHIAHSPNCSIAKAQRLLGYAPRYTSLQAVHESLAWLIAHDRVHAPPLS